ncbi:MAG: hypothetical protein RJA36_1240 [Pseudomonadota bacterium]
MRDFRHSFSSTALAGASLLAGGLLATGPLRAQTETARVISSTPVIQQVAVRRNACVDEMATSEGQKSGAGAIMGGIAGGALGNAIGKGGGRVATTMLGLVGGAMLGDQIEGPGQPQSQMVRRCQPQTLLENRITGYQVMYEFAGKQYGVQMPVDPGQFIQVRLTPVIPAPGVPLAQPMSQPAGQVIGTGVVQPGAFSQ